MFTMTIILTLKKLISVFLASIMLMITPAKTSEPYSAKSDDVKLNFSVLSDCHIEGNNLETFRIFHKIIKGVKTTENKLDAVVFLGDNTMNGQDIESMFFYGALDRLQPCENIFVLQGNHDVGNGEGDYEKLRDRFLGYNNSFFDAGLTKSYYYRVVNGCYMIFLASEDDTVNDAYITDEQIEWLEDVIDEAQKTGNPIFVFNHHPIYATEGDYMKIARVLQGVDNLLYFFGHTHWALTEEWTFYEEYGIQSINLPRCTEPVSLGYDAGIGMQVEVYEDEVVVRTRDYYDDLWVEGYERTYPII